MGGNFKKVRVEDYDKESLWAAAQEAGVYRQYNDSVFNAILEHGKKDSRYRKFLGKGLEKRSLLILLLHIVELFDDNTN